MKRTMLAAIVAGALLAPAWAQAPNPGDDGGDAPEHGVARLSLIQGDVSVRHGDQGEMTAGAINAPLVTTDQVITGDNSRAEVQFDSANLIRMAPGAEIRMGDLQYKHYLVQIAAGTVTFSVVRDNDSQVEISTPTVSVRPARKGNYRVTVQPDGMCEITVREGDAEIFGPRGSEDLHAGQTMMARGTPSDPEFQVVATIPRDDWDRWNQDRDRVFEQSASSRYVSPDVYGAESLDPYGRWVYDPAYGYVWVPATSPGWAPYQDGRWAWEDYYGWTWIGAEPWGWAPYHYGRWYMGSFGWAWWPGAIGPRYYWRPALVGFCGWGGGFGFGFGFGNVGWVPLAPFEPFRPWYGRGFGGGFNQVNIVNNVNITNVYRNARVTNAVTSVRSSDFGRGAVNSRNMVRASTGDLARGGQVRGAMPFTPSAQSRHFSDASVSTRGMPQARANTQFYSRGATQNQSRGAAGGGPASSGGFSRGNAPAAGAAQNSSQGNWRRFDPGSSGAGRQAQGGNAGPAAQNRGGFANTAPSQPAPNRGGGWQRFEGNRNPGATQGASPAPQNRGFSQPSPSFSAPNRGGGSYSPAPQRPVQINPPIVRDRGGSGGGGGYSHPQSHAGNFGGAHPSGGGGGGGGGNRGGGGGGGGHGGGGHR